MYNNCLVVLLQNEIVSGYLLNMDRQEIIIKCSSEHNLDPALPATLYIYHKTKGELVYDVKVNQAFGEKVILTDCRIKEVNQKRTETRVDLNIPIQISQLFYYQKPLALEKFIPGAICNLSANGVKVLSPLDLPVEVILCFKLSLGTEALALEAKILRKEKTPEGFGYGCRLININQAEMAKIRAYVFAYQIKEKTENRKLL